MKITSSILFALALFSVKSAAATPVQVETFDVSHPRVLDHSAPYLSDWRGTTPNGDTISANKTFVLLNGKPLPLTIGEFHPQRYPAEYWEEAILEMKAGGLNTIAGYWFWSLIEPRPGKFDFSGSNDIKRFLALCKKHDVYVFARIGPFCNAEFLCGGLPPWIWGMPFTERSNDPGYLERVGMYYNALGREMKGLLWDDGGPVIMVQVENELSVAPIQWHTVYRHGAGEEHRGPTDQAGFVKHYETLKQLAQQAGIKVPIYVMTGWGTKLNMPTNEFLVGFGAYMYLGKPNGHNSGLTTVRNEARFESPYPMAFIELGAGGTPQRLNYVGLPPAESAECTAISRIGPSDALALSWYMYHGGTNPRHPDWGFTAKRDDLALISYDYHAPISEYGLPRPAYYHLRRFHLTLLNYYDRFCDGPIFHQTPPVGGDDDKLRAAVRLNSQGAGMVFLSHYGNVNPLTAREAAIELKTATDVVRIPSAGSLALTNGDFAILPFNWDLGGGVKLVSATAQPSGKIENGKEIALFCSTIRDQEAEFVLELPPGATLETSGQSQPSGSRTVVKLKPALDAVLRVRQPDGRSVVFSVLPLESLRRSVEAKLNGQKVFLTSDQDIIADERGVVLTSKDTRHFNLLSYPAVTWKGQRPPKPVGVFGRIETSQQEKALALALDKVTPQKWLLKIPATSFADLNDIYARVDFKGLVCRIFDQETGLPVGDQLNADDLDWHVGLKRFKETLNGKGLMFFANGEDKAATQIMSEGGMTLDETRATGKKGRLESIHFLPEYRLALEVEAASSRANGQKTVTAQNTAR